MPIPDPLTPADDPACCWLSAHLYFRGDVYGRASDGVVLDVAEPFVRQCEAHYGCRRHFFVRYGDTAGPHVRLRLLGDREMLEREVQPALLRHAATHLPAALVPAGGQIVRWIRYEPETQRYGGEAGVAVAEAFFHASSEVALALLRPIRERPHSARLGKGLLAMLVVLQSFLEEPDEAADLCYRYATGYLEARLADAETRAAYARAFDAGFAQQAGHLGGVVEAVWAALEAGDALSDALDAYRRAVRAARQRLLALQQAGRLGFEAGPPATPEAAFQTLVPSYLHMTNNRLGLTIPEEAYLAHLIRQALLETAAPSLG